MLERLLAQVVCQLKTVAGEQIAFIIIIIKWIL